MNNLTPGGFNNFFIDKVVDLISGVPPSGQPMSHYLENVESSVFNAKFSISNVKVDQVYDAINTLSNSSCPDVYGLNSKLLKLAAPFISEPLAYLLNLCIDCGTFPKCLKLVKIIPLFKQGSKHEYNNFRPASIVPIISKVFEVIIHKQVISYF